MKLRFPTVRDLLASFPSAEMEVGEDPSGEDSVRFVRRCISEERLDAAISYCAYLLARRETVWWACRSVRDVRDLSASERECVALAHDWVMKPDEAQRLKALERGLKTNAKLSGTWVALAAGWSGGSIAGVGPPVPPPPHATPQAVRVALLSGASRLAGPERPAIMNAWIQTALRCLETGVEFGR